jgi:hypothetical protein
MDPLWPIPPFIQASVCTVQHTISLLGNGPASRSRPDCPAPGWSWSARH